MCTIAVTDFGCREGNGVKKNYYKKGFVYRGML